jgi:lipopolysaccharide transport system permease protein/teichoic acid transport system permease protein
MIFSFGLKSSGTVNSVPFVVHLITGIIAWFYIAGNLSSNTNVIVQHSFLLKRVDFRLSMLPIVNLMSSAIPHIFLICVTIFIVYLNGINISIYLFQLIYYFIAISLLLLGIGWLTSSSQLFIPDVSKFMNLIITFGFWLTPIFWDINKIPKDYQWIINLNPFAYIVQGYRDSIYLNIWFWEKPYETIFFWSITTVFLLLGITIFKRLRPHFAEVV